MTDKRGLFEKYSVRRHDGEDALGCPHESCFLFVLDIDHDPAALEAFRFYAIQVKDTRPQLAIDLMGQWAHRAWPDQGPDKEGR